MDQLDRLTSDVSQLTRRLDDFSMRLVVVEMQVKNYDDKFDQIHSALERWNKTGRWLVTLVGGLLISGFVQFAMNGGLATIAKGMQ